MWCRCRRAGTLLATAAQAPGRGWYWPSAAAYPRHPAWRAPAVATDEDRPDLAQVLGGPSDDPVRRTELVGALRRAMAKAGYCDLKEFQKVGLSARA